MIGQSDMSPEAIEARLMTLARLSAVDRTEEPRVSMCAAAIEARLCECAEMSEVCITLARVAPPHDP